MEDFKKTQLYYQLLFFSGLSFCAHVFQLSFLINIDLHCQNICKSVLKRDGGIMYRAITSSGDILTGEALDEAVLEHYSFTHGGNDPSRSLY